LVINIQPIHDARSEKHQVRRHVACILQVRTYAVMILIMSN